MLQASGSTPRYNHCYFNTSRPRPPLLVPLHSCSYVGQFPPNCERILGSEGSAHGFHFLPQKICWRPHTSHLFFYSSDLSIPCCFSGCFFYFSPSLAAVFIPRTFLSVHAHCLCLFSAQFPLFIASLFASVLFSAVTFTLPIWSSWFVSPLFLPSSSHPFAPPFRTCPLPCLWATLPLLSTPPFLLLRLSRSPPPSFIYGNMLMGQTQVKKNNKDLSSYRGEKHKLNTSESAHTINHGGLSFVLKSKAIHQKEQRKKNKGMLEGGWGEACMARSTLDLIGSSGK